MGVEVSLQLLLTSALGSGELSQSRLGIFYHAEITPIIHLYRQLCEAQKLSGRLGEWSGLFLYRNSKRGSSVVQPVT